jgi:prepilin-type N-terminal cleavage/methylation domain-containing protein
LKGGKVPMNTQRKEKGFTIIEVVLVLAIAGLIFLMVFIALPALQRSQRDTQRKSTVSSILTQITNYTTNNRSSIPTSLVTPNSSGKSFVQNYLGGTNATTAGTDYQDPSVGPFTFNAAGTPPTATGQIGYAPSAICGSDGNTTTGTIRQFAVTVFLESQSTPYCVDNH